MAQKQRAFLLHILTKKFYLYQVNTFVLWIENKKSRTIILIYGAT